MIGIINNQIITVTRKIIDADSLIPINGYYEPKPDQTFEILCNIQPTSGETLQRLTALQREKAPKSIITFTELKNGDILDISGENYIIEIVEDYSNQPFLQHYECVALKRGNK